MRKYLIPLVIAAAASVAAIATPAAAATPFTVSATPTVGAATVLDATALCPVAACSYQFTDSWTDAGHATHVITTIGYTAAVVWTPTTEDSAHPYVVVSVKVGVPQGRRVQSFVYQAAFTVAAPVA